MPKAKGKTVAGKRRTRAKVGAKKRAPARKAAAQTEERPRAPKPPKAPVGRAAKPAEEKPKQAKAPTVSPQAEERPKPPRAPEAAKVAEPKVSQAELDSLRRLVEEAKGALEKVQSEAKVLADKARGRFADAKDAYRAALAPYREACRKAGVECGYEGGRSANVSEKVSFLVEKTDRGVLVMVKGRPNTEEVIPLAALKESVNKAAYGYTDKHLGPKEEIGNKGGSLSNRLRAVMG